MNAGLEISPLFTYSKVAELRLHHAVRLQRLASRPPLLLDFLLQGAVWFRLYLATAFSIEFKTQSPAPAAGE